MNTAADIYEAELAGEFARQDGLIQLFTRLAENERRNCEVELEEVYQHIAHLRDRDNYEEGDDGEWRDIVFK